MEPAAVPVCLHQPQTLWMDGQLLFPGSL